MSRQIGKQIDSQMRRCKQMNRKKRWTDAQTDTVNRHSEGQRGRQGDRQTDKLNATAIVTDNPTY